MSDSISQDILFQIFKLSNQMSRYKSKCIRIRGQLYSKFSFGEVYRRIYGRKFSFTATCEQICDVINDIKLCPTVYRRIFTFPLRIFKWTFAFEMWFIPSWTNRFQPHPHMHHLSGLTSNPSNNVACLLTFAWRWTRIAMALSAEIWRFGYSKPYVMSDLIQNIWKTSQVRWKLKIDSWLII